MKINEYTDAVRGIYPGRRVRDENGLSCWISWIDEQAFVVRRHQYEENSRSWRTCEVTLDDEIRIGDDVVVINGRNVSDWTDDNVVGFTDEQLVLRSGRLIDKGKVLPR